MASKQPKPARTKLEILKEKKKQADSLIGQ